MLLRQTLEQLVHAFFVLYIFDINLQRDVRNFQMSKRKKKFRADATRQLTMAPLPACPARAAANLKDPPPIGRGSKPCHAIALGNGVDARSAALSCASHKYHADRLRNRKDVATICTNFLLQAVAAEQSRGSVLRFSVPFAPARASTSLLGRPCE